MDSLGHRHNRKKMTYQYFHLLSTWYRFECSDFADFGRRRVAKYASQRDI